MLLTYFVQDHSQESPVYSPSRASPPQWLQTPSTISHNVGGVQWPHWRERSFIPWRWNKPDLHFHTPNISLYSLLPCIMKGRLDQGIWLQIPENDDLKLLSQEGSYKTSCSDLRAAASLMEERIEDHCHWRIYAFGQERKWRWSPERFPNLNVVQAGSRANSPSYRDCLDWLLRVFGRSTTSNSLSFLKDLPSIQEVVK